jgi:hypothetical protein
MQGFTAHVSVDLEGRSLMYVILRTSPGDARITGATVSPLKAKASRAVLVHCMQREEYDVIPCLHL